MADIIDEVLSDKNYERKMLLFRRALPIIITITVIIAFSMLGYNWYQQKQEKHNHKIGDMFVGLISGTQNDQSLTIDSLENLIKISDNKQVELMELKIVGKLINDKNTVAAIERLEAIINNKDYHDITTSFARILWVSLVLDKNDISDPLKMKIRNYLQYFVDSKQPFFASAVLMKSLFYKKNSENDLALEQANIILKLENVSMVHKEQARAIIANIKST